LMVDDSADGAKLIHYERANETSCAH